MVINVPENDNKTQKKTTTAKLGTAMNKFGIIFGFLSLISFAGAYNNHPPKFLINGQTEIVLRLKEGDETPVGSLIYHLKGFDSDGDPLTFGIKDFPGNDILRIERVSNTEADIYLKSELDREVKDEYSIVLTLSDGQLGDGNFITQSLLILVEDVNDNEPVFKPYQTTISLPEDSPPGVITSVEATDQDEGLYGQVVYQLQELDGDNDIFSISTVNGKGVIRLVGPLDYEKKYLYQLKVLAMDRSNNDRVNTGTAAILVKVEDVEDQPPEFLVAAPVTRIGEDAAIGTPVLRVKAVDGDRGVNNPITYSISRGGQGVFEIDRNVGVVYTTQKLDRESPFNNNGAYIIEITAQEVTKMTNPPPSVKTEVTIIVTDINDEIPTFRSESYVAEINENAQMNTPVNFLGNAKPEVFDHDQGNNGTFHMFLEGDGGMFEVTPSIGINEASFLIRVKDPTKLDYEKLHVVNFSLIAKETVPKNAMYSVVPVTVHIRDMNDNVPEFNQSIYDVHVKENARAGVAVARVKAIDIDSGNFGTNGIRYTSLGGDIAELLSLDPVTGLIKVRAEGPVLDRELISRHYLTVEARDNLGEGNRNTVQLIVNVEDVNDNPPIFLQTKYEARLIENELNFESPLFVEAHDRDLNGTNNSNVHYSIVEGRDKFKIDPIMGLILPAKRIDFEDLAKKQGKATGSMSSRPITILVRAEDLGKPSLWSDVPVTIHVQDKNDNAPQFEKSFYWKSVPEDLPPGSSVLKVSATDADASSPNNEIFYRLHRGAKDKFTVDSATGWVMVAPGASLDPDHTQPKTTQYNLTIQAVDGGTGEDQQQSSVEVTISVVDVNNKPPILQEPGTIHVKENTNVGEVIYKVVAIDPDNKPILRYRIDRENTEARNEDGTILKPSELDYLSIFELGPTDGLLRVTKLLDREQVETIRLGLVCEDLSAAKGRQLTSAVLTIIVDDENDNNPVFRKAYYRRSITENSKTGDPVVSVVADDPDRNRTVRYHLEGTKAITSLLHLDEQTGEIVVAGRIDHEMAPWLNFSVRATDSGVPARSSLVEVFLQVLDENDNNPVFIGNLTNLTVMEDAPVGTEIGRLEARDADSGDFGKVTYLLDRLSSNGKFQIHPDTGVLTVAEPLDREEHSSYLLVIQAWDNYNFGFSNGESRNAFKQIEVIVLDVNDETPVFEPVQGCATVTEFHEMRDTIIALKAHDNDDPNTPNGRIVFSILGGNEKMLFRLERGDESSVRVMSSAPLRGYFGNYTLLVEARDQGTPSRAATLPVPICVEDFNDHAPRFTYPPQNATIRVPEDLAIGQDILQVVAEDVDIGLNGAVRYRLKRDAAGAWRTFAINETTGTITLRMPLDRERQKIYELRIEAYDLGIPTPLSSDLELIVYVKNVNDFQPQFTVGVFRINFTEHQPPGAERFILAETIDRDEVDDLEDPPSQVCYFIVGGNSMGHFILEPLRHELSVAKELDREEESQHILIVKATEDCLHTPPEQAYNSEDSTLLQVLVRVTDINDHPPQFISKIFTGGVTTNADFGTQFMTITAYDADEGKNGEVKYYQIGETQTKLAEGMESIKSNPFIIDEKTGGIKLNFYPQKGMKGYFDMKVLANDTDGFEDSARVFIYLLREDQRVRFVLRQHPSEIREKLERFRQAVRNVTSSIVNVDEFKVHENKDGSVDNTKTDLYLHFVNEEDNSVIDVHKVLSMVDSNIELLDGLFKEFDVLDTQPAEATALKARTTSGQVIWLLGVIVFLGIMVVLILSLCFTQRSRYKRAIKAATTTAFGSSAPQSDLNRIQGLPNTNMHSVEGSNPMWMKAYENEWYKEDESISHASDGDSLDNNAVVVEARVKVACSDEGNHSDKSDNSNSTYNSTANILPNSQCTVKDRLNDLNRSQYHQNLYTSMSKIGHPLVGKKLETTEL